jgi:sugar O-acyltransferase (sialic acid O-acetyltransferase NeuD family)
VDLRVACAGAGGHGKVVADIALSLGLENVAGFLDDDLTLCGRSIMGLPVLGRISAWRDFGIDALIPAIGTNLLRRDIMLRERAMGAELMTIVHPKAVVSGQSTLYEGVVVFAGAVINAGAIIGENVIVNTGAIVEHDCQVGSHVHLAPACCIAGEVQIGEGAFLGMGSRVLPGVKVGDWCVIGAGAVVTKDVADRAIVAGVPARRLR